MIPMHHTIDETGLVTIEFESEFETLDEAELEELSYADSKPIFLKLFPSYETLEMLD